MYGRHQGHQQEAADNTNDMGKGSMHCAKAKYQKNNCDDVVAEPN
jgi:hypothetical protein